MNYLSKFNTDYKWSQHAFFRRVEYRTAITVKNEECESWNIYDKKTGKLHSKLRLNFSANFEEKTIQIQIKLWT